MKYVTCDHHKKHAVRKVKSDIGDLWVYNTDKYRELDYCTGDDDVSRTIINTGGWEKIEAPIIRNILENGDRNKLFMDFGSHIGYYSVMGADMGYQVIAIDSCPENMRLLERNAKLHNVQIDTVLTFIEENDDKPIRTLDDIQLVKIDVEGAEPDVVNQLDAHFRDHRIEYAFIEVSPVFNDRYPDMVKRIADYGYNVTENGEPFDWVWDFAQTNLLFEVKK